ncbi:MAG TPA: RNA polymerase sigma-70 factor [Bacteroidales bacterium]|nr:RNA polymerase sigma-70 factor [Bacteroidales bacterium]
MKIFPSDYDLVERLQKGEAEAFDLIYDKYSGKLYAFSFKYLRSADEAEELVQSVFLKIWENRKYLKKESSLKSFLFTIAYNDICKFFRRKSYLHKFINDSLVENSLQAFEIDEKIEYQSALERVKQLINKLPDRQKVIFKKSREEGKTTKEIAAELELSPGTVDNYISNSLRFIRSRLMKDGITFLLLPTLFFI